MLESAVSSPANSWSRWRYQDTAVKLGAIENDRVQLYASMLRRCGNSKDLKEAKRVHSDMISSGYDRDRLLGNLLVEMYGKCRSLEDARAVFQGMRRRNVFSWTILIVAYAQNELDQEAVRLFREMDWEGVKPDEFTFSSVLDACAKVGALSQGKLIHARVVDGGFGSNIVVATALINMYGRCRSAEDAKTVFENIQERSVILSTAMVAAYAQNGHLREALELFEEMQQKGLNPDLVAWTAMITAYAQDGHGGEALKLFQKMNLEGLKPDKFAFVGAIDACASIPALAEGKAIHSRLSASAIECDGVVGNALVNLYGKCGNLENARSLFAQMVFRNVVTWSAIVAAYAQNGHCTEAAQLFREMQQEGVSPNKVTFVSMLFACSHAGLIDESLSWFFSMDADYNVKPTEQHCVCVIDILGRAGRLEEAEEFLKSTGFRTSPVVWEALLSFCSVHGDLKRGASIADLVLQLDSENASAYILVSNIYRAAGRWDDAENVKKRMAGLEL